MPDVVSTTDNLQPDYLKKVAFKIFELGHGYRTCAQVLDLSIYTVREWYALYKFGAYDPETLGRPFVKRYNDQFRQKVLNDYFENKPSITELAKRYDVSKRTVKRWIDEANQKRQLSATKQLRPPLFGGLSFSVKVK